MVEDGRHCLDIAQQLHAVEKAIQQAKRTLVLDHRVMVISGVWKQVEGVAYPVG
jgi:DNA-binding FrmR family transcriptional regulator